MPHLELILLDHKYLRKLFEFEQENKAYFELSCHPRPESYNEWQSFKSVQESFIHEIPDSNYKMFLLLAEDQVVGRINLTELAEEDNQVTANIGYRIAKACSGRGYASEGVRLLLEYIREHAICDVVYGGAAIDNFGSQIVMLKNQFQFHEQVFNTDGIFGPGEVYIEYKRVVNDVV